MQLQTVLDTGASVDTHPHFVCVFPNGKGGGNPAPIVLNADRMTSDEMMAVAARYGHESAFVCAPRDRRHSFRLRFFVPQHEMEMCGHATVGTLWLLRSLGHWNSNVATLETLSGIVEARFNERTQIIEVSQPKGVVQPVDDERLLASICKVLRIDPVDLDSLPVLNSATSRTKTLIPLRSIQRLHALSPNFEEVRSLCDALQSTGLYPFAVQSARPFQVHARQFPRSSGYPEDAATGIAAAALLYGVLHHGLLEPGVHGMNVHQGYAMNKPSLIRVELRNPDDSDSGCWIGGAVERTALERLS
ncbi:PhzF family phenazine biosynthesis protein [Paraburkholderia sp. C35]|uniref:PhzF family phenazine biosynthesis protein n=1 Tax=Paraburkholderia sp. C35 TaxID=2126993 RepID=UPI000D693FDD|nr:PhzF family phenazine biosynthesis protein [Paraburkholderia sp. C35]